ncbi:MAG: HD-GYP domain-containing protein [Magnetococcales bacterium]|nr:HD-GYP domain-containing protein [Magnetococcales bacterium]
MIFKKGGFRRRERNVAESVKQPDAGKIKKIAITDLKPGMVISGYVCDWGGDPAHWGRKTIRRQEEITKIQENGIEEVYIDTAMGMDVADAPTLLEVKKQAKEEIEKIGAQRPPPPQPVAPKTHSMQSELANARKVTDRARQVVADVLVDVRLGKQMALGPVREAVEGMAESAFSNLGAILSLSLIKRKDEYTFMHSVNVGVFLMSFCHTLGMEKELVIQAGIGGMLHDAGKMKVPLEILNSPNKLTDAEFDTMKAHPRFSGEILRETEGITPLSIQIAEQHHERFNGSGYPGKLAGDKIGLFGQMAAIVDVYDAITSNRSYHKGMASHEALEKMYEWCKHHFDLALFQQFVQCVGIYPVGSLVRLENGQVGVVIENHRESLLLPVVRLILDSKRKSPIPPKTVDLLTVADQQAFRICGHESPTTWGIDPKKYMPQPELYR